MTVGVAVSALVASVLASAGEAGAATTTTARAALPASKPAWLPAKTLGAASTATKVGFRVYLSPKGGVAAEQAAVLKVSTPGTSSYRRFLTAAQFHTAYDPSAATVASVRSWLATYGLKVTSVASYNAYLQVAGTVAAAQKAFGTNINRYVHNGIVVQANATQLTAPAAVAAAIVSVTGLDTTPSTAKVQTSEPPPDPVFENARPCSLYYGQLTANVQADLKTPLPKFDGSYLPYAVCGYTGPQFRSAYENNSSLDGSGVTVGVLDAYAAPTLYADANKYATENGDGSYAKGQFVESIPASINSIEECDAGGWYGEQSLDVEAIHAMAPGAKIHYYGAASCNDSDLLDALALVVNQDVVSELSNSYGEPDEYESTGLLAAYQLTFLQAGLEGISLMFSSGDDSDELADTGLKQTDSSASDPFVTAVGGTATAIDGNAEIAFQTGWGTDKFTLAANQKSWSPLGNIYGSGGGYSYLYNRPAYQNGVVPADAPPGRAVPDVSMDADPTTGMLVGQSQTFPDGSIQYGQYRIGGTSLASPLFTGMTALLLENTGGRLGFLNPLIYSKATSGVFSDIKGAPADAGNIRVDYVNGFDPSDGLVYSVRTFNQDASLGVAKGWDDVTGVGSPNASWLTSVKPIS